MKSSANYTTAVTRTVVAEGCAWTVYEQFLPYSQRRRALVFMSDRIARRVTRYPSNWFDLPDDALAELSKRT